MPIEYMMYGEAILNETENFEERVRLTNLCPLKDD